MTILPFCFSADPLSVDDFFLSKIDFISSSFSICFLNVERKVNTKCGKESVSISITTVFVDTRLWKTKHSRKRFQNFR